ncbi:MAG: hypothetical protein EP307_14225 [Rhodobacteraceae bacterium]|nr:MAG: hypothetical protein EP307_14225 [Paracoccaceae bacterium]
MPRAVLMSLGVLLGVVAIGAVLIGRRYADRDMTEVITLVAERHVARHGGDVTACRGWPREDPGGIAVRCGGTLYLVDALGRIRQVSEGGT